MNTQDRATKTKAPTKGFKEPSEEELKAVAALVGGTVEYWRELFASLAALTAPPPIAAASEAVAWPKSSSVKRRDDMSASDVMQVGIDESGDLQVSLWTDSGYSSVEFCSGGGNGGGRSPNTRRALIALMVAMETDEEGRSLTASMAAAQPSEALIELVAASDAHHAWCERQRLKPKPPLFDPRVSVSSFGITHQSDPENDAIITRLNKAWESARTAAETSAEPFAWARADWTHTGDAAETEACYRRQADRPEGNGWIPLYAYPPGDTVGAFAAVGSVEADRTDARSDASGWLIEHSGVVIAGQKPGIVSWLLVAPKIKGFGARELSFTHDASKALRFARSEDAEAVLRMYLGPHPPDWYSKPFSVTEHMWPSALTALAEATPPRTATVTAERDEALPHEAGKADQQGNPVPEGAQILRTPENPNES